MKYIAAILFFACITACVSGSKWTPSQVLVSKSPASPPKETLSAPEVREDIDFLKYVLDKGYGGKKFLPNKTYKTLISQLDSISGERKREELLEEIDTLLMKVPDSHLRLKMGRKSSTKRKSQRKKAQVGGNLLTNWERVWSVKDITLKKKKILFISILYFPSAKAPIWKGFLKSVTKGLLKADVAVIDLRDNGGGDDSKGLEMASLFHGGEFRYPIEKQYYNQGPVSSALRVNGYQVKINARLKKGKRVPEHFYKLVEERRKIYDQALSGKLEHSKTESFVDTSTYTSGQKFEKPIYILVNSSCGSSCESTVDAFEFHPSAQTVGENTAGFVHFGNVGYAVLPHSQLLAQIPTTYAEYFDKRFIERVGITPKVKVPQGKNAFDYVVEKLL